MLHIPGLFIALSEGRGRGVFTAAEIHPGDLIEVCPLILIPPEEVEIVHQTVLHDYYFLLPEPAGGACIALGYGSIYNHSPNANASFNFNIERREIEMMCDRLIEPGEEIFIDYAGYKKASEVLWFEVV